MLAKIMQMVENAKKNRAISDFFSNFAGMMTKVTVTDSDLRRAAQEGMDAFIAVFVDALRRVIGDELNAETMARLNSWQLTLLGYDILRSEVMDGGFVQLIHNGYGPFFFLNPFAKMLKQWGMRDLSKMIYEAHTLYLRYKDEIAVDCSDDEFMAMFERFPEFDDLDDAFVEHEEEFTSQVAHVIDENIEKFAEVTDPGKA